MHTVRDIIRNKGKEVWHVSPDAKVIDALRLMADKNIGAVLVLEDNKVKGIFSERDYARKVVLKDQSSKNLAVKDIMSSKVIFITPDRNADECMALMLGKKIRHLPVYENDELQGVISIGDVVKTVLDSKEFMIDQLVEYIKH